MKITQLLFICLFALQASAQSRSSGAGGGGGPSGTTYTANQYGIAISDATNATLSIIAPDASTTKVLTSGGASASPTWSAVPATTFGAIGAAAAGQTIDNTNYAQIWNWSTLTSATAIKIATASTGFTGKMLQLENTTSNAGVTGTAIDLNLSGTASGMVGINIVNAGAASTGRGINIDMQQTGGARTGLAIAHAGTNNSAVGLSINMSAATSNHTALSTTDASAGAGQSVSFANTAAGFTGNTLKVTNNSTADAVVGLFTNTGASGNQIALDVQNAGVGGAVAHRVIASTGNLGTGLQVVQQNASSTAYAAAIQTIRAGVAGVIDIYNSQAAANNTAGAIDFYNSRTGTAHTLLGRVAGMVTDIDATNYRGALLFYTAKGAAPTEHLRIDAYGHMIYTGTVTVPTAGAGSCGTTPGIAGNDMAGRVTIGASPQGTTCTITFANAYATAPVCTCMNETTAQACRTASTTTTTVITGTQAQSDVIAYSCVGY